MTRQARPIYLIQMNHFDPIWRRCWDRRFTWGGQSFASYAEIEQAVIDDWLTTADKGPTTFVLEQTVSLRKYLERNPDRLERLRQLAGEGRFEILAAGETVNDANMPLGESLVRNLLYGITWVEQTLGVTPAVGCRNDGFGSPAQIPQIFRQCEIDWLPFISYRTPDNDYWRGLDGTCIYTRVPAKRLLIGSNVKLRPCDHCNGTGCSACRNRGFDQTGRVEIRDWLEKLDGEPFGLMSLGGEETLPCMDIVQLLAERTADATRFDYRFGTYREIAEHLADDINAVDDPAPERITRNPDIALSSAGCWVTRIKLKQRNRRAEHALLAAETLTTLASLAGADYPARELAETWRTLVFTHFHDAITATHVDPAYEELIDMYDTVDRSTRSLSAKAARRLSETRPPGDNHRTAAIYNTMSWSRSAPATVELDNWPHPWAAASDDDGPLPVYDVQRTAENKTVVTLLARNVPAFAGKTIRLSAQADRPQTHDLAGQSIENDLFRITANDHGITSIFDKHTDAELIDYAHYYAGELILEHDYGDPWATRRPDHQRERLSAFSRCVSVRRNASASEIVLSGQHPGNFHDFEVNWLTWTQRVVLADGLPYVEFITDVDWDTHNRRLRIAFPTTVRNDTGDYEVPYGTLRRPRYDNRTYCPNGINGDWPVTHWAAPASDAGSVAVINRGECSYRIEGGNVLVSLLRSPTTPWCMYEPEFYRMPLFDGMRDAGQHTFRLALYPFVNPWPQSRVTHEAWGYNVPFQTVADCIAGPPVGLFLDAAGSMITTVKRAETGDALIARLYEYAGQTETVTLTVPKGFSKAQTVNLLERQPTELKLQNNRIQIEMRPFKLATIRLERRPG